MLYRLDQVEMIGFVDVSSGSKVNFFLVISAGVKLAASVGTSAGVEETGSLV